MKISKLTVNSLLKFFEDFMDETCDDIGNSSTEDITVTRIKRGLMLTNMWSDDTLIIKKPRDKKDYWRIEIEDKMIEKAFKSEKKAIKHAKELCGDKWAEYTIFYQYYWVKPTKGHYGEESYSF